MAHYMGGTATLAICRELQTRDAPLLNLKGSSVTVQSNLIVYTRSTALASPVCARTVNRRVMS
jgi:hypothetical protein